MENGTATFEQLVHQGVCVPAAPELHGLVLTIRGQTVPLTAEQEEMALAWARKQGTEYVEDPVFVHNFMADFGEKLGLDGMLSLIEVDFGPAIGIVDAERAARARLTREERRELAAERRAQREALRERYGTAIVNGQQVELANYVVEPSGIFMGRGQHPLRGRWKEGARESEITLNLSPDAPRPEGDWGEIVWEPESLWVARWRDKLSGKMKYVWLSDTAPIKQERERAKFDQAHALHAEIESVRAQIELDLNASDPKQRMLATVCYLIDALCLRVGDEKDADEADTVGATTLREEHVTLHRDGPAEFRFLGKDSILWHKRIQLPPAVWQNLDRLIHRARSEANPNGGTAHPAGDSPQVFPDISSRDVNGYLSEILPGLTAKVFRTHHATMAVKHSLARSGVSTQDPEHLKWEAASLANVEAAVLCNHTKKPPASWERSRQRYRERVGKARERVAQRRLQLREQEHALALLQAEAREQEETAAPGKGEAVRARYGRRIERAQARLERARAMLRRAETSLGKVKAQASVAARKRTWNLGTSLKSYIDPRVYYEWGREVDYDVLDRYYPKALRERFAWVREEDLANGL